MRCAPSNISIHDLRVMSGNLWSPTIVHQVRHFRVGLGSPVQKCLTVYVSIIILLYVLRMGETPTVGEFSTKKDQTRLPIVMRCNPRTLTFDTLAHYFSRTPRCLAYRKPANDGGMI
jgi:hypothetical protein